MYINAHIVTLQQGNDDVENQDGDSNDADSDVNPN
jgi:hypothetical protein